MSADFNPQPKPVQRKKPKRDKAGFREMILELDPVCRGCGDAPSTSAHHIKYRSNGGKETAGNGIGLCELCDHNVHHGITWNGVRLSAREYMLGILTDLRDDPCYRWHNAHRELRTKAK